jgi:ribose transport system ATP-binding protein
VTPDPLIELRGVEKSFPGVKALKGIDFDVLPGEVHCLVGENGAGKSTLIKLLAGVYQPEAGQIFFRGEETEVRDARHAEALGIAFIFQELDVVEQLSVADNVMLGHEQGRVRWDRGAAQASAQALLDEVGVRIDARRMMSTLSPAQRQLVLIARALSVGAGVIVMDEPTATLTNREREGLFAAIERQRARGISVIYVSHRLDEIFRLGDRLTILRDGERVATLPTAGTTIDDIVSLMVGRALDDMYERSSRQCGSELLRLDGIAGAGGRVRDVSLSLHAGEVLGIGGLIGSGRTEVARLVFGADELESGHMTLDGEPYAPRHPRDAIRAGVALVPEQRRAQGIVGARSVRENISLAAGALITRLGFIRRSADGDLAHGFRQRLSIRTPSLEQPVQFLSGGNQQKVVLAKWLATDARVLVLDEPTRGVDVGAKNEIFHIVDQLAAAGTAVLMISSELEEIVGFCDRVIVMRDGRAVGSLQEEDLTLTALMSLAAA